MDFLNATIHNNMKKALFFSCILHHMICSLTVHAQEKPLVYISSSSIFLTGVPDEKITGSFTLTFDTSITTKEEISEEIHLETEVKTWFLLEENKDIRLNSWIRVTPKEIVLLPGEPMNVRYRVQVPPDAQGYLMAMITFETIPYEPEEVPEELEENQTPEDIFDEDIAGQENINGPDEQEDTPTNKKEEKIDKEEQEEEDETIMVYSLPVYLVVEGRTAVQYLIRGVSLEPSPGSLAVSLDLENTGNVFIRPEEITIAIYNEKGSEQSTFSFSVDRPLLPKKSYTYAGSGEHAGIVPGDYTLSVTVKGAYPPLEMTHELPFHIDKDNKYQVEIETSEDESP